MATVTEKKLHLLSLPYDVRHLIYDHLFPPGGQLYIQAMHDDYISISPDHRVPTSLLRTCRQLHEETSEYLYNNYLFNIFGRKQECVGSYDQFQNTVLKYARDDVHTYAFGNGEHSATMCISLHAGDGKMDVVKRRERGVELKIEQVRRELVESSEYSKPFAVFVRGVKHLCRKNGKHLPTLGIALLGAVGAYLTWLFAWNFHAVRLTP